jgi:hypothetical protein
MEEEPTLSFGQHVAPHKRTAATFEVQLFIRTVEFPRQPKPQPAPVVPKTRLRQTGIAIAAVLTPIALAAVAVFLF